MNKFVNFVFQLRTVTCTKVFLQYCMHSDRLETSSKPLEIITYSANPEYSELAHNLIFIYINKNCKLQIQIGSSQYGALVWSILSFTHSYSFKMVHLQDEKEDPDLAGTGHPKDCWRGCVNSCIVYLSIHHSRHERNCIVCCCQNCKYFPCKQWCSAI